MSTLSKNYLWTAILMVALLRSASGQSAPASQWVFVGPDGKLHYQNLNSNGDHIMDFSSAGYLGGGVSLPSVPVQQSVSPSGGDDTSAIQAAINAVAALAPDANGFRGAVLLAPGTFNISATLNINASGVILRGSGSGSGGTVINMTGALSLAIRMAGSGSWQSVGNTVSFTDSYVPSGTNTVNVSDSSGFQVGDTVRVIRTVTDAWVHFMGMDTLVRGGVPQTWLSAGTQISTDRSITAISGNQVTFDVPLTDSFDSVYLGTPPGTMVKYTFTGRISQAGLEHLQIVAPVGTTVFSAVTMDAIIDSWIEDVVGQETQNAFNVNNHAKRITLDNVINNVSTTQTRAAGTADFAITGTQVLVNKCQSNGTGDWPLVTQATGTGPIVVLNFSSTQHAGISPHQRWTTGVLTDNASIPNAPSGTPGIAYRDRGTSGSGHGWTSGWSVAWNVTTPFLLVQQPPGTENWCIGCVGTEVSASEPGGNGTLLPNGIFDSLGTQVTPSSLYLAQLCERLGPAALTNIGYSSSFCASQQMDFLIAATPNSQIVVAGNGTSYTATVTPSGGFSGTVNLSVSGLPSGATGTFNPTSISGGSGSSTLSVATSKTTPAGTYSVTITGMSGSLSHSTAVSLTVNPPPDFSISATPNSQMVTVGGSTSYTASVAPVNGYSGTVNLSATVSGSPAGVTTSFNPASISGGSGSSVLSVATTNATPAGTYTITITGTDSVSSLMHSTTVSLTVNPPPPPDFSISATPTSQTVTAGGSTSYTASVSPLNGFSSTVNLSVSGLPSGASGTFNPASISGGSGSSTLNITTSTSTAAGTYALTITGTSGSLSHSASVSLVVNPVGGGLPPGWSDTDVGTPGVAGSASFSAGTFTVNGSGSDIWSTSDNFNYASESMSGDITITARVAGQQNTNLWAKSGVMMRETTAANSSFVHVFVTPGHGVNVQYRASTGALAVQLAQIAGPVAPYWVRLVRSGSTFTGYTSADGTTWTQVGQISVTMASNVQVGLAVTAHSNTVLNTSTFDNVTVSTPGLPAGWGDADIGAVGVAGSAGFDSVTFTVNGSGSDIWSTSDSFNYASKPVSGDVTITARVASQQNTNLWAKSGVMIRETTAANSSFVHVFVTPGHGVNVQYRASTGAGAVQLAQAAGPVAPYWVRLVRSGNTFTGFTSADGVNWTQVATISVTMTTGVQAGLAVTAHNNTALNTSTFDNVTIQ